MPEYVRNFSKGLIDEARYHSLHQIVTQWLLKLTERQYMTKANTNLATDCGEPLSEFDSERLDKNFMDFLDRFLEWSASQSFDVVSGKIRQEDKDEFDEYSDTSDKETDQLDTTGGFNNFAKDKLDA